MFLRRKAGPASWLVVFLGNPGAKYDKTRHNAGFMAADLLEKSARIRLNRVKFKALTGSGTFGGEAVFFMKPQTFMNLSGEAVAAAMRFYKLPLERVIVVTDDTALPLGKLRVRRSGSAGGHNGLKDIIQKCGGDGFPRVKIGVGAPPHPDYDLADWVLSSLTPKELKELQQPLESALGAVEAIIKSGIDKAMNLYN